MEIVFREANFNPRTHEECDYANGHCRPFRPHFNPRTHEECDDCDSFHAAPPFLFQSTHSRGVRLQTAASLNGRWKFQSTHSRGVRPGASATNPPAFLDFNPRTHEECDGSLVGVAAIDIISIHALTRSATMA